MNLTDILLGNENSNAVTQLAKQLNISESQARDVIAKITPTLTHGMKKQGEAKGGLGGLLDALNGGKHSRYIEQPDLLGRKETVDDGNSILGHIFGNKDVSRNVAKHVGEETSLGSSLIKKALPIVATMVMGTLGKSIFGSTASAATQPKQSGGLLTSLLDSDNDGSIIDDVLGMAFKAALR